MKWEFLGNQDLHDSSAPGRGHTYRMLLWRTPAPGGWLLMTLNDRSNDPQPVLSFYPDPAHTWSGVTDPQADYLLRAASHGAITAPDQLLRPGSPEDTDKKRLEP